MMKKKYKQLSKKKRLKKHFKENLRFGLVAATGFTIAFAWRVPLSTIMNNFVSIYIPTITDLTTSVIAALIVTFLGAILLYLVSRFLK